MARLLQCLLFFTKARISLGQSGGQHSRIDNHIGVRRWLHGRSSTCEGIASVVVFTGKFLAVTEERPVAGIVRNLLRGVLLNLSNRFVEASLVVELQASRHGKGLVLGIGKGRRHDLRDVY